MSKLSPERRARLVRALRGCTTWTEVTEVVRGAAVNRHTVDKIVREEGLSLPKRQQITPEKVACPRCGRPKTLEARLCKACSRPAQRQGIGDLMRSAAEQTRRRRAGLE